MLETGATLADLGCGAGILLLTMARAFHNSTSHGFERSKPELEIAARHAAKQKSSMFWHDATKTGETSGDYKEIYTFVISFDVLHDCTHPKGLIVQVKTALIPTTGIRLLADIPSAPNDS